MQLRASTQCGNGKFRFLVVFVEVVAGKAAWMQHNWLFLSQALGNALHLSFKVPGGVFIGDL